MSIRKRKIKFYRLLTHFIWSHHKFGNISIMRTSIYKQNATLNAVPLHFIRQLTTHWNGHMTTGMVMWHFFNGHLISNIILIIFIIRTCHYIVWLFGAIFLPYLYMFILYVASFCVMKKGYLGTVVECSLVVRKVPWLKLHRDKIIMLWVLCTWVKHLTPICCTPPRWSKWVLD